MAREAGFNPVSYTGANLELFERFAALVAAREREACADVCVKLAAGGGFAADCAEAIQSRGEQ